jgi:phosphonate transport system permease protein
MSMAEASARLAPPQKPVGDRIFMLVLWIGLGLSLAAAFLPAEVWRLPELAANAGNLSDYGSGFTDPNFHRWAKYLQNMGLTIAIALWGTLFSVLIGTPLSLLCANNVAPFWIVRPFRFIADIMRSINDIVYAVLFVVAVGIGPFAGVMAVCMGSAGVIAKLFSEAVETIDPKPVEGVRAVGATRVQEVLFGILPQVAPLWTSLALYRFESNVRSATVLGIVGAGGIGQSLLEEMRGFHYRETAAIVIIIIVTVFTLDFLSSAIRKRMV